VMVGLVWRPHQGNVNRAGAVPAGRSRSAGITPDGFGGQVLWG